MTAKIDSSEVLSHLNKYGIRTIDEDAFKRFMKDLKKLMKLEQQKMEALESNSPSSCCKKTTAASGSGVGCNCDIRISSCCPENSATVTYVHRPRKINQELVDAESYENHQLSSRHARSTSSLSRSQTHYKTKRKIVNDPVQLYHYYQSIWRQHKLPGENDHSELRQAIRNRLMNIK